MKNKSVVMLKVIMIIAFLFCCSGCASWTWMQKTSSEKDLKATEEKSAKIPEAKEADVPQSGENFSRPVIHDIQLGPGDELQVSVWMEPDLERTVRLDTNSTFFYPLIGEVQANNLTVTFLRSIMQKQLSEYLVDPQVLISILNTRSQKVFVLGEVRVPGIYQAREGLTALEAVSSAGGFTKEAASNSVLLVRKTPESSKKEAVDPQAQEKNSVSRLDLKAVMKQGKMKDNIVLQRSDILYVPENFITNVDQFFQHFHNMVLPILDLERGIALKPTVEDVLRGNK